MIDFTFLLESYTKFVRLKGYKTGNGMMYITAVKELFQFLQARGYQSFAITTDDMASYYHHLTTRENKRRGGTLSDNTINHHLFGIKVLFDYVLESNLLDALPVLPKYHRNPQEPLPILSVDEIKKLYANTTSKMETALLSVAYGCGLRRKEISQLLLSDIDLQKGFLIVRKGKGSKRREVPFSDKVMFDIKDYIHSERRLTEHRVHHLFITPQGNVMSGNYMNDTVKSIVKRIPELSEKTITLHTLRRSIATHLVENGAGIHFIKDFLGHVALDTTQLYTIRRKRTITIT